MPVCQPTEGSARDGENAPLKRGLMYVSYKEAQDTVEKDCPCAEHSTPDIRRVQATSQKGRKIEDHKRSMTSQSPS